jgi:hypothetical protein
MPTIQCWLEYSKFIKLKLYSFPLKHTIKVLKQFRVALIMYELSYGNIKTV